jgi:hypothetical protein
MVLANCLVRKTCLIVGCGLLLLFAPGCSDIVLLQNLKVEGSVFQPTMHIKGENDTSKVRLSISVLVTNKKSMEGVLSGHTQVNQMGIFAVDTIQRNGKIEYWEREGENVEKFSGNNFQWKLPQWTLSCNAEISLSTTMFLTIGVNGGLGGEHGNVSGQIGVGDYTYLGKVNARTEIGYAIQSLWSSVEYVERLQEYDLFGEKAM